MTSGTVERRSVSPAVRAMTLLARPLGPRDPGEPVRATLADLGVAVQRSTDASFDPRAADAVLVWGNAGWFPSAFRLLGALPRERRPVVAVWHAEPLPLPSGNPFPRPRLTLRELVKIVLRDPRATDPYSNARQLAALARRGLVDLLVVTSEDRREFLAERGIEAEVVPRGYHPSSGADLGRARDVDVLFLGDLRVPRRRRLLRALSRAGIDVLARGSWTDQRYWGDQRAALLNRAKIVLNVGRHPGQFAGERFTFAMANGALVVSEPVYRPAPFRPGEHYVEAPVDRLAETIRRLLAADDERRRIAARGHALVTRELTMSRSVARVLELLAERLGRADR